MEKQTLKERILRQVLRFCWTYAGIITAILFIGVLIFLMVQYGEESKTTNSAGIISFVLGLVIWVILGIIGIILRDKYITYLHEDDTRHYHSLPIIRTSPGGKVLETGNVMWGKENIHKIKGPRTYRYDDHFNKVGFRVDAKIISKHANSEIVIPVTIEVLTNGQYDPQEAYDKMIAQMNTPDVDEFVKKIFLASAEANKETIDQTAKEYAEKRISNIQLLDRIISVVEFPEKTLKNFKDVTICLDNPRARACKGTSCEQIR